MTKYGKKSGNHANYNNSKNIAIETVYEIIKGSNKKDAPKPTFTMTINPSDDFQCWGSVETERVADFVDKTKKYILKHIFKYVQFKLNLEVSPLGRLHWHGTVTFSDNLTALKGFYLYGIPNITKRCQLEIDTIDEDAMWLQYIMKQQPLFKTTLTNDDLSKIAFFPKDPNGVRYVPIPFDTSSDESADEEGSIASLD